MNWTDFSPLDFIAGIVLGLFFGFLYGYALTL